MISAVSAIACTAVFAAYGLFALALALRAGRTPSTLGLFAAGIATSLWAASNAVTLEWTVPDRLAPTLAAIRDGLWPVAALALSYRLAGQHRAWRLLAAGTALAVVLHVVFTAGALSFGKFLGVIVDPALTGVILTVLGVVILENLVRNCPAGEMWSIKHFAIALACLLGFQILRAFPEFLTHKPEAALEAASPVVYLVILPLLTVSAIRIRSLQLRVHTSRKFVFHTAAIVSMGVLLQGAAVAAFYVRSFGGDNATVLAVLFIFASFVLIVTAAASASLRSRLRTFINENFFSYKYDYRVEWDRFNRSLASQPGQKTAERVLRTLLEILDSTGGALWARRDSWRQFQPVARSAFSGELPPINDSDPLLKALQGAETACLVLDDNDATEGWKARFQNGWLVIPLPYQGSIAGFAVIAKPRAPRTLDWEDFNLVKLVAAQLAVYLVQEEIAEALADARQLADFNRRSAFIIHDLKNTAGQMALLAANAEKFGQDPDFRTDMIETLQHSAGKLRQLLDHLQSTDSVPSPHRSGAVCLDALLAKFTSEKQRLGIPLTCEISKTDASVPDPETLRTVMEHVISNAIEASPPGTPIDIRAGTDGGGIRIAIADKGEGMTPEFIANELFRPMHSTKASGLGIGAWQARELIRALGGDIQVDSRVGQGTTITLLVPASGKTAAIP